MAEPTILPAAELDSVAAAIEALWAGGIVAIPTETVYGLAVLPHAAALAAMIRAKRRPGEKGIALIVDSLAQVEALAVMPETARRLAQRFWPGPLTLVLPPRDGVELPGPLYGATGALGFRLPDHPTPRSLAARLGPIAISSANVSGEPDSRTAGEVIAALGQSLALVLDGGRTRGGIPSTVMEVSPSGLRVLREGAIPSVRLVGPAVD